MAECAIFPSNLKLHWGRRIHEKGSPLKTQKSCPRSFHRNCKSVSVSLWSANKYSALSSSTCSIISPISGECSLRCSCLGTMIDIESAAASDWVPVVDQLLLTASVFLTYMAGVAPSGRSYMNSQRNNTSDMQLPESPIFFGSTTANQDQNSCPCTWDAVKEKIMNSLLAIDNGNIMETNFVDFEQDPQRPLSLYAVATGPRFRLLLSSIEQLEKEVNEIPGTSQDMEREQWLELFSSIIKKSCQSAFIFWMEKELCRDKSRPDEEVLFSMSEKLKEDDIILGTIRKSGKMDLYADLMHFLRYGFLREYSCYDYNIYSLHGGAILEDLVITVADALASMYLELMSVDSDISEKLSNISSSLCTLSTRALQKLRNEVAMCQWIHQNFGEIVLMYEDRFDLRVLKIQPFHEPVEKDKGTTNWWRILMRKPMTMQPSLSFSVVSHFSMTVKRTRELRGLKGWRYYFSLLLELADIAIPMIKAVTAQVRNAISFLLVSLIGRSVGLVYTGIRQSLRWK